MLKLIEFDKERTEALNVANHKVRVLESEVESWTTKNFGLRKKAKKEQKTKKKLKDLRLKFKN